jgi:hypothetical protein
VEKRQAGNDQGRTAGGEVAAVSVDRGQGGGLRGPPNRHGRAVELTLDGERYQRDADPIYEHAEGVLVAAPPHEVGAEGEMGQRGGGDERAFPGGESAPEHIQAAEDSDRRVGHEERLGPGLRLLLRGSELVGRGRDGVEQPVGAKGGNGSGGVGLGNQPRDQLRSGDGEGNRRQPAPRPDEGNGCGPDQRDSEEGHGGEIRRRAKDRRSSNHRDEAVDRHRLRVHPDGDRRDCERGDERAEERHLGREEPVEPRPGEQRQRHDAQADGYQDVAELLLASPEHPCAQADGDSAAGEAHGYAGFRADPAAAEGEAQEEDRTEHHRGATDPGQQPARQLRLHVAQRSERNAEIPRER